MTTFTQDVTRVILGSAGPTGQLTFTQDIARAIVQQEQILLVLNGAPTGMVGILTVSIVTLDGEVVYPATTSGITETPAGTGRYVASVTKPGLGSYFVLWSDGTTTTSPELLRVFLRSVVQTPIRVTSFSEYGLKVGDTEPGLVVTLRNAGGSPLNLSSATGVNATVLLKGDILPTVVRPASILEPLEDGQVLLTWEPGDTDVAGVYVAEFGIVWTGDGRSTAPTRAAYRFVIEEAGV